MLEGKEVKVKNFFIPNLSSEKKRKLQEAAVAFCDMNIDDVDGIVIDEESIAKAMQVLGAHIESETITSYDGVVRVALSFPDGSSTPAAHTVSFASWNGRGQDAFKKLLAERLLPAVKTDIVVDVPHQNTKSPVTDGKFYIHIWSSPAGNTGATPPEKMWGIKVDCQDSAFQPSGQGIAIYEDGGWPVAELVGGNNLYIHHDACNNGTENEVKIFCKLFEEVIAELTLSPKEKKQREKRLAEERQIKSRQQYVSECTKRFETTVSETKKNIETGKKDVDTLQQNLIKRIREAQGYERKLEQIEATRPDHLNKYGQEYDKLLQVAKVKDVRVADGVVKVFTDTLFCVDPRTKKNHEIGAFRIEIYTNGANNGVRWFNLTRRVEGYKSGMQAPHVFPAGNACMGNTQEIFPELIANYEFAAVAMVAIQFVESVNTDDAAGKYINNWPLAEGQK